MGCLFSACSLSFASDIVHMKGAMHTLHWMFIAAVLVAFWLPVYGVEARRSRRREVKEAGM